MRAALATCMVATASLGIAGCGGSEPPPKTSAAAPPDVKEFAGPVSVSSEIGGLNAERVDATFSTALAGFKRCLDEGAERVEFLGGSVSFFVKINAEGRLDHAHVEHSTLGDRDTEKCMLSVLRAKRWPKPVGGMHGLAHKSFEFDPPNDVRPPADWRRDRVSPTLGKLSHKLGECKDDARGSFEATIYVNTEGRVLSASVTPPDEAGESSVDCLVEMLRSATFPSPGSWPAKVTFTL
jgi:hypothetical protein